MSTRAAPAVEACAGSVEGLRSTVDAAVAAALAGHAEAALVSFPTHWNLGDTAIWAGQCAVLDRLGVRVPYVCDSLSYRPEELRDAVRDGPILLSGGGNFGDVYPTEQGLRERVLEDFPERTVVQLPQSVWFRSPAALDGMRRRCERHGRLVLMVRDRRSHELVRSRFAVPVRLVPDMAFGLPDLRDRRRPPSKDVLWLLRRDIEAVDPALRRTVQRHGPGVVRDWTRPGPARDAALLVGYAHGWWLARRLARLAGRPRAARGPAARRLSGALVEERMRIAVRLLSEGRVTVSDRLHGHVLALLLGIPHVCLDNRDGKVGAFHATWTAGHPLVRWADSLAEARVAARGLLAA